MQAGLYTVRSQGKPGTVPLLERAVIEVEDEGTVFVLVHGEPREAFPHADAFLGAHALASGDLFELRT